MKPPITGTPSASTKGAIISRTRVWVWSMRGMARPNVSSVTRMVRASNARAGSPRRSRAAATISQDSRSPMAEMASSERGVSSSR